MTVTQDEIDATLNEVQKELSSMLSPLDIPLSWTGRQLNAYEDRRALLNRRVASLRQYSAAVRTLSAQIANELTWRQLLTTWREQLQSELASSPRALTVTDIGRRQNLELSIRAIEMNPGERDIETLRLGVLMRDSGIEPAAPVDGQTVGRLPWNGCLPSVDERIAALELKRQVAQERLHDALLSDQDRERLAQEAAERCRALNSSPQRKRRGDGTLYDKFPDGRCVEVIAEPLTIVDEVDEVTSMS